jgi:hypothetical protein
MTQTAELGMRSEANGEHEKSEAFDLRSGNLADLRVLVVDDEPDARDLLALTLTHSGRRGESIGYSQCGPRNNKPMETKFIGV